LQIGLFAILIAALFQRIPADAQQSSTPVQPREQLASPNETRAAELVYKNIQVLKGMPAPELLSMMKAFTEDLGVRCEFCHVTALGSDIPGFYAWSSDDIEAKTTARRMIRMVMEIDKAYFAGTKGPTCWTCHRGKTKPELEKAQ
jgi:hypothetical protein